MTKLRIVGRHALLKTVTVMGALSVTSTPVFAEADEAGRQIEEVMVTAERREASIQDTSISITAFTGEMLDDLQRVVSKPATQRRILVENPKVLYGFSDCEA